VWSKRSGTNVRTMPSGTVVSLVLVPGDMHVIAGTQGGDLEIYDVAASSLVGSASPSHEGAVWAVQVRPDRRGIVADSADQYVRLWDFDLLARDGGGAPRLDLLPTHSLRMNEEVTAVRYSPDGRLLAVALLDSTIKVLFADSLKVV